jgi:hypothetical protein
MPTREEDIGAVSVGLTLDDLRDIDAAASKISEMHRIHAHER